MGVDFFAFGLKDEYVYSDSDKFAQWVSGLEDYLKKVAGRAVTVHYSTRPEAAPWIGRPFLIIGSSSEVDGYLRACSAQALEILRDCAYFWFLSDDAGVGASCQELPKERTLSLVQTSKDYGVLWGRLEDLVKHPDIVGLSNELYVIRSNISRIASQENGPGTPVLVLGESGSGKSAVAQALSASKRRPKESMEESGQAAIGSALPTVPQAAPEKKNAAAEIACGYFTEEMLQDQLFGHYEGAFTGANKNKKGLLARHNGGTLVLHDVDAAPAIQSALLSVFDTKRGESASITRLGGEDKETDETNVWLIFTTNADIGSLVEQQKMREDFLFRFEDRVIFVPPLHERRADLPAIARHIWESCWAATDTRRRGFSPPVAEWLSEQGTKWRGNVRALRALLSLAASMAKVPAHHHRTLQSLLAEIMSRGPEYPNWIGILATRNFSASVFQPDVHSDAGELPAVKPGAQASEEKPLTSKTDLSPPASDRETRSRSFSSPEDNRSGDQPRPSKFELDPLLLTELKRAGSPKWLWLTKDEDEDRILFSLRDQKLSAQGLAQLDRTEQWLKNRESKNPRRIHYYKLLFYLVLADDHAGVRVDFQKVLDLSAAQTSAVLTSLIEQGWLFQTKDGGTAHRFVLAQGML
jgi:DNA-binding NtrC family response regulator